MQVGDRVSLVQLYGGLQNGPAVILDEGVGAKDIQDSFGVFQPGDFIVIGKLGAFVRAGLFGVGKPEIADPEQTDDL